jgi:hypothetical protein
MENECKIQETLGSCNLRSRLYSFLVSVQKNCLKINYSIPVIHGEENQLDATQWFIELAICCTCFGHLYAHHQELETILLVSTCGV